MKSRPDRRQISVKICGITGPEDAKVALDEGADYVGVLVEVAVSPRSVSRKRAVQILARAGSGVVLTYDAEPESVVDLTTIPGVVAVQLCGSESPDVLGEVAAPVSCDVWKSIHLPAAVDEDLDVAATLESIRAYVRAGAAAVVLDTALAGLGRAQMGGTGVTHDWRAAARIVSECPVPVFLAGGLNPENVAEAIRFVRPAGVDASSGVESCVGVKDPDLVLRFVESVRGALG